MKTTWIIGADPGCDLVIDLPSVSRRHCRLSRGPDGSFAVLDLGSTNGTYVNGQRVLAETPVGRGAAVTLGLSVPMPWPATADVTFSAPPGSKVFRVGREHDNDLVIDSPEVSGHHARVLVSPGGERAVVEDLGSTNGTAVGEHGPRAKHAPVTPGDVLYFGPIAVPASRFFEPKSAPGSDGVADMVFRGAVMTVGRDPACDRVVDLPVVSGLHARFLRSGRALTVEDLGSSNGTYVNARRVEKIAAVVPGDLVGFGSHVVRMVDGEADAVPVATPGSVRTVAQIPPSPGGRVPRGSPSILSPYAIGAVASLGVQSFVLAGLVFAMSLRNTESGSFAAGAATVWVGLSAAFVEKRIPRRDGGEGSADVMTPVKLAKALARTGLVTLCCSFPLMWVVLRAVPDTGHWPAASGVLLLTALAGAALGRAVACLTPTDLPEIPVAVGIFAAMLLVTAVPLSPPTRIDPVVRSIGRVTPIRWCFEGLLLLSADENVDEAETNTVQSCFPAETDRYGTSACTVALLAMLGGLLYADAVIALTRAGRPRPAATASR